MTGAGEPAGDGAVTAAAIAAWEDPPRAPHPGAAPVLSIVTLAVNPPVHSFFTYET